MKSLLILFLLLGSTFVMAQDDDIDSVIKEMEKETTGIDGTSAPVQVIAPAPVVVTKPVPTSTPTPATVPSNDDVYQYAYSPKDDKPVNYTKEDGERNAGDPGNFVASIYGEFINYVSGSKSKGGISLDLGPQFNFSKYLSLALTASIGTREGNEEHNNLYPLGLRVMPKVRVLSWLFPFLEGGVETAKVAKGGWESPFWIFGGGLMFNIGSIDRRSEYNLYKATSIRRTFFVFAVDKISAPVITSATPDSYIIRIGMSLEF